MEEVFLTIGFILIFVIYYMYLVSNNNTSSGTSDDIRTIPVPSSHYDMVCCKPDPSARVRKQGIGAVQGVFSRYRRATEDYLVEKGVDISGNLSKCIDNAYENGKINENEKANLKVMNKGGVIGCHKYEAEKYMKEQSNIRFRDTHKAAKNLGIEMAAYL